MFLTNGETGAREHRCCPGSNLQGCAKANQNFITDIVDDEMKQGSKSTTRRTIGRHLMAIFFRKSSETHSNAK